MSENSPRFKVGDRIKRSTSISGHRHIPYEIISINLKRRTYDTRHYSGAGGYMDVSLDFANDVYYQLDLEYTYKTDLARFLEDSDG